MSRSPAPDASPVKVLLIEDNPGDARLILELLSAGNVADFALERVDRLQAALERLQEGGVDVVLLDLGLPDCEGLDTFRRAQQSAPEVPIIVISGLADERVALEAVRSGAQDYLVKGRIEGPKLARAIRYAIERMQSATELRASEERFRELAENVREVFLVTDAATGRLLYTNPAYEPMFGHSREYAYSKPLAWTEAVHPEDRERMMAAPLGAARVGKTIVETFRVVGADGTIRWVRSSATPVKDSSGTFSRVVGIAEDITELKRAEERFYKAQKMEAVGRLAGGVAHDFNNLLVVIMGTTDLLLEDLEPADPQRADLEEIRQAGARAAALTRQLLAFSRNQILQPKVLEVNDLVADLEKLLQRLIGEDVKLKTVLAPDLAHVRADPPAGAGDREPRRERPRRDVHGWEAHHRDYQRRSRPVLRAGARAGAVRTVRHDRRVRYGDGNERRDERADLRTLLHHEGAGEGYRPRSRDRVWHRQAIRWLRLGLQRGGKGHDLQDLPPAGRPARIAA